jgi:hypothetical protein
MSCVENWPRLLRLLLSASKMWRCRGVYPSPYSEVGLHVDGKKCVLTRISVEVLHIPWPLCDSDRAVLGTSRIKLFNLMICGQCGAL